MSAVFNICLSVVAITVSAFGLGYSMANWHFSSTYVRDAVVKRLEKELRWRLQVNKEMTTETTESTNDAMDK